MRRPLGPFFRALAVACVLLLTLTILHAPLVRAADPDTDLDGLPDSLEAANVYTQRVAGTELPKSLVDGGAESSTTTLASWQGIVNGSFAEFTINHPAKSELTVQVGYWDGEAWVDRYVWDPGSRLVGVSILEPAANDVLAGTVTVTAVVPADDTVAHVAFLLGTSLIGKATTPSAPNRFSIALDTTAYRPGAYDLIAIVLDKLGAPAAARIPVSIQDTAKPSVSFVAPLTASSVTGSYRVRVRATDADGLKSVRLRIDSGNYFSIPGNFDGLAYWYDWATTSLRAGLHTLTAEAKDNAGKTSTASVTVVVDNTLPTASITSPASGASLSGTITVTATASDNLLVSQVLFTVDGRPIGSDSFPPYKVAWDTRSVPDGSHLLRATSFDEARNAAHQEIAVSTSNGGEPPDGIVTAIVASLTKPRGEVTLADRLQRILPAEFAPELFHSALTWRIVVRDWDASGTQGSLDAFALRLEERSDPAKADTDGDTLTDGDEVRTYGTYPTTVDTDGDGVRDDVEVVSQTILYWVDGTPWTVEVETNPTVWDTDGDGLSDGEEYATGVDRVVTNPVLADTDGDTLTDGAELATHNSNATLTDTDQDTIRDDVEVTARLLDLTIDRDPASRFVTTLPYAGDSDGDGLRDDHEFAGTSVYGVVTDPSDADTDDDGLMDGQEKYALEFSIPTRKTVGTSIAVPLTATYAGDVERVDVRYGLSNVDVSNFFVELTKGSTAVVLRDRIGSGLYEYGSAEITTSFGSHGGVYMLEVSSAVPGGVLEEYALTFTLRTSPIRFDSDGDGLNDSEETTYGADAWITDANRADSDGDTWSDGLETGVKATNPLSVDTDQDGAPDDRDLDPLRNLLVAVGVDRIRHGASPGCSPELVGVIRVNDDYAWVTEHVRSTLDPFPSLLCRLPLIVETTEYSTSAFGVTYYSDVPDDVPSVSLRATAWSINPFLLGDHVLVDQGFTYTLNSGTTEHTPQNGDSRFSFNVSTVALPKATTLLITDGNATVVASNGQHRLAGQDRYFVLTLNVTSAQGPLVEGVNTIVVPRSLFLLSALKADFDAGGEEPDRFGPLADATLYGEDLGKADVSEGVAGVIAKALSGSEAFDVLDRLLRNTTGVPVYAYVDVTSYATVANLPPDVVRILPWIGLTNGPTGPQPQDFWQKIEASVTQVVNALVSLGQLLYKGLLAGLAFLENLAEAIVDWGMRALGAVSTAVAGATQVVAQALQAAWDWLVSWSIALVRQVIDPLIASIRTSLNSWNASVAKGTVQADSLSLDRLVESLFSLVFLAPVGLAVLAMIVGFSVAEKGLMPATAGVAHVLGLIVGAIMGVILGLFITEVVSRYSGSRALEELIPDWYDEVTGLSFKIAGLILLWELKVAKAIRPLVSITGVETSLYLSIMSLLLLGVTTAIAATVPDRLLQLKYFIIIDAISLSMALIGSAAGLKVGGGGIRYWYPLLYPISVALGVFSTITAAFKTGTDIGELATYR